MDPLKGKTKHRKLKNRPAQIRIYYIISYHIILYCIVLYYIMFIQLYDNICIYYWVCERDPYDIRKAGKRQRCRFVFLVIVDH